MRRRAASKSHISMSKARLVVRLGTHWTQFAYKREELEMLGTVQCAAQIGALARLPDGTFAQVNGDWTVPLSASRVRVALRQAEARPRKKPIYEIEPAPVRSAPPSTPVVIVRRKRRIPQPSDA